MGFLGRFVGHRAERHDPCSAGRGQFLEPPGRVLGQPAGEMAGIGLMAGAGGLARPKVSEVAWPPGLGGRLQWRQRAAYHRKRRRELAS